MGPNDGSSVPVHPAARACVLVHLISRLFFVFAIRFTFLLPLCSSWKNRLAQSKQERHRSDRGSATDSLTYEFAAPPLPGGRSGQAVRISPKAGEYPCQVITCHISVELREPKNYVL
jgi:hypothetical protein